jgi:DNA-binding CsgD family transcriptional regulator
MKVELAQNHRTISTLYEKQGEWEKFAMHFKEYHELSHQLQNDEVKKQAERFGWEQKIAQIEKQNEIDRLNAEREKLELEHKVELQAREVENTIHELVNKNSFLHEVRKDVKRLSRFATGEGNDVIDHLLNRLERNIVPLESKAELERQWEEVHADFIHHLKTKHPDFTAMELKIASLLKMKLTSSNISAILFLSKRTVEFHRLNIRKKMGLKKEDDLHVILNNL